MSMWFVIREGKEHGPIETHKLKELASKGRIQSTDLIRRDDMKTPKPASQVKGLFPEPEPLVVFEEAKPEKSSPPPLPPLPAAEKPSNGWVKKLLPIMGVIVLLFGGVRGCIQVSGGSVGTITLAEDFDMNTMKTFKEGRRHPVGELWTIIRSKRPFGDAKLLVYLRQHGAGAWISGGELVVDPTWTIAAQPDHFEVTGKFDVRVTNSKGKVIAESTIEVVD